MKSTLRAGLVALLEAHPKDEEAQEAQDAGTRPRWRSVMLEARDRGARLPLSRASSDLADCWGRPGVGGGIVHRDRVPLAPSLHAQGRVPS